MTMNTGLLNLMNNKVEACNLIYRFINQRLCPV